jgi:hypothetical protein
MCGLGIHQTLYGCYALPQSIRCGVAEIRGSTKYRMLSNDLLIVGCGLLLGIGQGLLLGGLLIPTSVELMK